ncbi:Peptidyl-prolyl cis-trans isomerase G [Amphibalanus amphitrite]|uniref:peptidylprolyl isomerase n=1 Tax=Amphibalanus amphitrite TaxID=1232801 RepID=A0A6A4WAV6_AMPAM|nr:Peptidyl-prolyl cis-trans isomerase G [Amphibalanus amphitrite]
MPVKSEARSRCFFDLEVDGVPLGRVVFELFSDVCPRTAENFRALCTGERGLGERTQKPLHYQGVKLHRIVRDFMIQGGDFSAGNGTGGESIYGGTFDGEWRLSGTFDDENFELEHDRPFLLSMANRGKDTNGSQFFLVHVVFGQVVSGQEVVSQVEAVPTDNKSRPLQDVRVARCGQLVLQTKHKGERAPLVLQTKHKGEPAPLLQTKHKDKKKKKKRDRSASSEEGKKKKSKKDKKDKHAKEKVPAPETAEGAEEPAGGEHPLTTTTAIDPDEIPAVPENRFLERSGGGRPDRDRPDRGDRDRPDRDRGDDSRSRQRRRSRTEIRAGKKVKGRGFLRYDPEMARSRSRTPPHWRVAQKRTIKLSQFERMKEQESRRAEELKAREEQRQKRHAERDQQERERHAERDPQERERHAERDPQERERERRHAERHQRHRHRSERSEEGAEKEPTEPADQRGASSDQRAASSDQRAASADRPGSGPGGREEADVEDIHDRLDYEGGADEAALPADEAALPADEADDDVDEDDAGRRLLRLIQERQKRRREDDQPRPAARSTSPRRGRDRRSRSAETRAVRTVRATRSRSGSAGRAGRQHQPASSPEKGEADAPAARSDGGGGSRPKSSPSRKHSTSGDEWRSVPPSRRARQERLFVTAAGRE